LQDSEATVFPATAMRTFERWLKWVGYMKDTVGVVDTTFFDSGWVNYYCTMHGEFDPLLGHRGLDLRSFWGGATRDTNAKLNTARIAKDRPLKHHAGDDAYDLAETARVVLFEKLIG
jgi:hypothetical protein